MTSGRGFSEDMRLAHVLADQADSISLERFRAQDLKVDTKPDLTPVTDADRAVEEMLRITLSRARTRDAVMGEEFGTTGHGPRRWVLDPIDGTKNFVRGVPVWATLIALFDGDEPVVGLVSAPALNRAVVGGEGRRRLDRPAAGERDPLPGLRRHRAQRREPVLLEPVRLGGARPARRLPRPDPLGVADPRLRRLLELRAGGRGRGRRRHRAGGVGLGPRRPRRDRAGGRRPVHRPVGQPGAQRRQRPGEQRRAARRGPRPRPPAAPTDPYRHRSRRPAAGARPRIDQRAGLPPRDDVEPDAAPGQHGRADRRRAAQRLEADRPAAARRRAAAGRRRSAPPRR